MSIENEELKNLEKNEKRKASQRRSTETSILKRGPQEKKEELEAWEEDEVVADEEKESGTILSDADWIYSKLEEGIGEEIVIEPEKELLRFYAKRNPNLSKPTLRVKGCRNLTRLSKRVNSDSTKLKMQNKLDVNKIDQAKATNRHWKEVKFWSVADSRNRTLAYQEKAHPFKHNEKHVGVNQNEFERLYKHDPYNFFLRLLGKATPDVGHSTLNLILNATNDNINVLWNNGNPPPTRKIFGLPESKRLGPAIATGRYVTGGELVSFLGIQFLIGYHRLPELKMFWEQQPDSGLGLGIIQQSMTRERFKFISKHIAFASPVDIEDVNENPEKLDQIALIHPLIEALNDRFKECCHPPKWQNIDESMVKLKDLSMLRQTLKNKRTKSSFKILSRCDDRGYTYQIKVHHDSLIGKTEMSRRKASENVVLDLVRPLAEQGHIVTFGRNLTSVSLMRKLYSIGVNAVGMILPNRVKQPVMSTNESNLIQGEFVAKFGGEPGSCRKGLFIWKEAKAFRLISNFHGSDIVEVKRKQRDGTHKDQPFPKAIDDYVNNMDGVDTANQLRSYYERDRRTKKWWHRLFYSLMETTLVNSWICFNDLVKAGKLDHTEPLSLLDFKRSVTIGLLTVGLNEVPSDVERLGRLVHKINPGGQPGAKRRKDRLSVRDELRFAGVGIHLPIFVESRGRCEWCQKHYLNRNGNGKLESRPFSKCKSCNVFLCLTKRRNCFNEYHDEKYILSRPVTSNDVEIYSSDDPDKDDNDLASNVLSS